MGWYEWRDGALVLELRVQPRARRDAIAGPYGERLRVCVKAPPVDGKANDAVTRFLADAFGVTRREVTITRGVASQNKTVLVQQPARVPAWFGEHGGKASR